MGQISLQEFCSPRQACRPSGPLLLPGPARETQTARLDQRQGAMPSLSNHLCPWRQSGPRGFPALTSWPHHDSHTSVNEAGEGLSPVTLPSLTPLLEHLWGKLVF